MYRFYKLDYNASISYYCIIGTKIRNPCVISYVTTTTKHDHRIIKTKEGHESQYHQWKQQKQTIKCYDLYKMNFHSNDEHHVHKYLLT